jgi:ribose transport system substrate-binding protein
MPQKDWASSTNSQARRVFHRSRNWPRFKRRWTRSRRGYCFPLRAWTMFKSAIDGAITLGIPVICIDSDAPNSRRVLFIGTDNFRAGMESGGRMGEILKGQGRIVIVSIPVQNNLDERVRGVNEALKKFPGIKVAQTIDDKGDPRSANDQISTLLAGKDSKEKINGIREMRDGVTLQADIYRPKAEGKFLVLLVRTPYASARDAHDEGCQHHLSRSRTSISAHAASRTVAHTLES